MILLKGRPKDESGREAREIRVYDYLDRLGIEFYRVDHARAETMNDCEAIDIALETVMCKNLVLCNRQHTGNHSNVTVDAIFVDFCRNGIGTCLGNCRRIHRYGNAFRKSCSVRQPGKNSVPGKPGNNLGLNQCR